MTDSSTQGTGDDGCARLEGELTFESVPRLHEDVDSILPDGTAIVDLSAVTVADSAGLALLLEWQASARKPSGGLQFINAPASLISLASLCEASELLNISGRDPSGHG